MLRNKIIAIVLLWNIFGNLPLMAQEILPLDSAWKQASDSYAEGRYREAVDLYESILTNHGTSYEVYYNMGNAYYKMREIAPAILNYERAMQLNPKDEDLRFNLQMAQEQVVDKIEHIGEFRLVTWYHHLGQSMDANTWAVGSLVAFGLFILCLFTYFFSKKRGWKKCGFYIGWLCLFFSAISLQYSLKQQKAILHPEYAIVFSPSVTVKSSPDQSGTDLFLLHEGTKVHMKSTLGEWVEIELEDGNLGWLESKHIQIISL